MGIDLTDIDSGNYTGSVSVIAGGEKQTIPVQLKVAGDTVPNHGYNLGNRLSRLNWLNSNVGINNEITKGYIPVKVEESQIRILGRTLDIAPNGLPASINTFFGPSNQSLVETGEPVVNQSFRFIVEKENGDVIRLVPGKLVIKEQKPSKVVWNVLNTSNEFDPESGHRWCLYRRYSSRPFYITPCPEDHRSEPAEWEDGFTLLEPFQ